MLRGGWWSGIDYSKCVELNLWIGIIQWICFYIQWTYQPKDINGEFGKLFIGKQFSREAPHFKKSN